MLKLLRAVEREIVDRLDRAARRLSGVGQPCFICSEPAIGRVDSWAFRPPVCVSHVEHVHSRGYGVITPTGKL